MLTPAAALINTVTPPMVPFTSRYIVYPPAHALSMMQLSREPAMVWERCWYPSTHVTTGPHDAYANLRLYIPCQLRSGSLLRRIFMANGAAVNPSPCRSDNYPSGSMNEAPGGVFKISHRPTMRVLLPHVHFIVSLNLQFERINVMKLALRNLCCSINAPPYSYYP